MCGIAGIFSINQLTLPGLEQRLQVMNTLQQHRGPDGEGIWTHPKGHIGFGHRRLSIIDLSTGDQPMRDPGGNWVTYNGEIYNYIELRQELGVYNFQTTSDTEVILHAYRKWGTDCVNHFRGMFAFALWDEANQMFFCARDRFGIKPFYYTIVDGIFYFSSEVKGLLPFLGQIETDIEGLKDYLVFQFCLTGKTLFKDVHELLPSHSLTIKNSSLHIHRYWEVYFNPDFHHTEKFFEDQMRELLLDSVSAHLRADVPLGAYVSGGLDSSTIAALGNNHTLDKFLGFTGKFPNGQEYDESQYARAVAEWSGFDLYEISITGQDFIDNIQKVTYHMDYPAAGPGSFPQYMVSQLASKYRKVVLGGQGGDEIFGGYTRYLVAYFEQCIKAAVDGTMESGNFVVTYESIIPNLKSLRNYKPMLQTFWSEELFEDMDRRYFRLVNRAPSLDEEVDWAALDYYSSFKTFKSIFNKNNVRKESYFDLMTHFDFKTLLPALLQVEDRVSMAHGLESRVPLLDHPIVELAATIPANIKFANGEMKHIFKKVVRPFVPDVINNRTDKMGFPTPLTDWVNGVAKDFVRDIFSTKNALSRPLINNRMILENLEKESKFGRKVWGMLSLELWQQEFHDQQAKYKKLLSGCDQ